MSNRFRGNKPWSLLRLWYSNQLTRRLVRGINPVLALAIGKVRPLSGIGKAKFVKWEDSVKLIRPVWKVILKLCMTLVGYCSRSMLSSPDGGVEPAEGTDDDVCNPLGCVKSVKVRSVEGTLDIGEVVKTITEKRSRVNVTSIAKMTILKTLNPEFVVVPIKGWRTNFPVCLEELMNLFPCS
jgi:hypothetical protein